MDHPAVRFLLCLLLAMIVAAGATALIAGFWVFIGGGDLTIHGWIALTLGVLGTIGLSWGLMSLAFRSHRDGWDDRVDNSLDPGREGED